MQHGPLTYPAYPGSCKICFFHIPVFGENVSLIFPTIYLRVGLRCNLHIGLSDLFNPLISADTCPGWHNYSLWGLLFHFHSLLVSWLLNFIVLRHVLALLIFWASFDTSDITFRSTKPKPVYLLTVQEAHKDYNSLDDQIWAKYEQLDSGKFGAVGTIVFNTEACKIANLFAHMNQLCQRLNLPTP